jgi:hypothetical protein
MANTDADCIVPSNWLTDQLELACAGIEAFAGTVSVDSFEEDGPEVPGRFRASYRIDVDLRKNSESICFCDSGWVALAFAETNTATAHFRGASVCDCAVIGSPGWYLSRAGF